MNNYRLVGSAITRSGLRVKVICHADEETDGMDFERVFCDYCRDNWMEEPHFFEGVRE